MNFIKKHNYRIQLAVLSLLLLVYVAYSANMLWPDYLLAQETSVTLETVYKGLIFVGNVYFMLSLPLFFIAFAGLKNMKNPQSPKSSDWAIFSVKIVVFAIWVFISHNMLNGEDFGDDMTKIATIGFFGGTIVSFDVIYLILVSSILSLNRVVGYSKDIKNMKKLNKARNDIK